MTPFEYAITYILSWWMVLFMVLPHRADAPAKPEVGHAPSAPANPMLKKKFLWTTLLAIIPTLLLGLIIREAQAEETIYHAGTHCKTTNYKPNTDISTKDGVGAGGKAIKPATMNPSNVMGNMDHIDIPLEIPSAGYINRGNSNAAAGSNTNPYNADLSQSFIQAGRIEVNKDGSTTLNGQSITPSEPLPEGCNE